MGLVPACILIAALHASPAVAQQAILSVMRFENPDPAKDPFVAMWKDLLPKNNTMLAGSPAAAKPGGNALAFITGGTINAADATIRYSIFTSPASGCEGVGNHPSMPDYVPQHCPARIAVTRGDKTAVTYAEGCNIAYDTSQPIDAASNRLVLDYDKKARVLTLQTVIAGRAVSDCSFKYHL